MPQDPDETDALIADLERAVHDGDESRIHTLITALAAVADHAALMRLRRKLDEGRQGP
ncbi:hypothetical protein [Streptomyces sp. NBC_00096]|uniref:hypothetical protein n=1 Tax=Streptomyces sp. NBC_00096 TaxID=2975650 RepID=UPI00324882A4